MQNICIPLPRPGPRLRVVIVIIIYMTIAKLASSDIAPMAVGSILAMVVAWSVTDREAVAPREVIR